MEKLKNWFLVGILIPFLIACGGGGGGPGVPSGSTSPSNFLVNAPTAVTLTVGQKAQFPISGGRTPYISTSTVSSIADASIEGGSLVVLALKVGSTTVRVTPTGGGAEFLMSVTVVTNASPLSVQAPGVVTIGIGNIADYALVGGIPPYRAVSSDSTLLKAETVGSQLRLTGIRRGSVTVDVYDSDVSNLLPIIKTVNIVDAVPLNTSAPSSGLTIARGLTRTFMVAGGVAPYFAESNDNDVAEVSVSGASLSLKGVGSGSAVVTLRDSSGGSLTVPVSVTIPLPFFTTAPSSGLVVGIGVVRDFEVGGGVFPYTTPVSTNASVATATLSGTTLRITGQSTGTATITVRDAGGSSQSIAVTVGATSPFFSTAPSTGLVVGIGLQREFQVGGGTLPYATPVSTNASVATAILSGTTLRITGQSTGTATITVRDAGGSSLSIAVTVGATSSFFSTAPSTGLVVGIGLQREFEVGGGTLPYATPVSTNASVATATLSGTTLRITGQSTGTATITVRDAGGSSLSIAVTVGATSAFFSTAPSTGLVVGIGLQREFEVGGGTLPYSTPVSTNASVATATLSGTTLRITGQSTGTATIAVRDAGGSSLSIAVTVGATSSFFSTAPSTGLVVGIGLQREFEVGGGALPYATPVSTNASVATATLSGTTLRITGHSTGTTTIAVRDAAGATLNISVAAGSSDALLTTAPNVLTMDGDTVRQFEVVGGVGYAAQSNNNSVVFANIPATPGLDSKAILTLTAISNGSATVFVTDSRGRSLSINVTVVNGSGSGVVSSVDVTTDKLSLLSASGEATIIAFVKNASNVAMPNMPVQFSSDSGTLLSADSTTNASGVATAKLAPGSNRANRDITVRVAAGAQSGSVKVAVTGSTLTITGSSTQQLGATASYSVRAVDSSGNPLAGMVLAGASTLGNTFTSIASTDAAGNASFSYTAVRSGTDTLVLTGPGTMRQTLGVTISAVSLSFVTPASNTSVNVGASQPVTVRYLIGGVANPGAIVNFSSTRGVVSVPSVVTNASGEAVVDVSSTTAGPATITAQIAGVGTATLPVTFVATTPATITLQGTPSAVAPNQPGSSANQATLSAVVRDASGNLVAGQLVNFNLVRDLSGGSLSAGTAVTDASGRAQVQFIAGSASTPANGVEVRATVAGLSQAVQLTVSGSALFISFGISNEIGNLDPTIYSKRFAVYVTDANGVAVGNQVVNLAVIPTQYRKGTLEYISLVGWSYSVGSPTAFCSNEDRNGNGILDLVPISEDTNRDGRLTPGNVVVASPGVLTTDSFGRAFFDLQYGEQYVPWLDVRISARASVAGTESVAVSEFSLVGAAPDFSDANVSPAGVISPFGRSTTCINSN